MIATFAEALGTVVAIFVVAALLRTVRPTARRSGSRYVLEYGVPLRCFGIVALLAGGLILYSVANSADRRPIAWVVGGALAACAFYAFVEFFFVRVEFDESFIYPFSPWRGSRRIPRSDITSFHFSATNHWYVIRTRTHGTFRVSGLMCGIGSFVERLRAAEHL